MCWLSITLAFLIGGFLGIVVMAIMCASKNNHYDSTWNNV